MADSLNTLFLPDTRPALEALIEAAIAHLDALDGDPELEDTGDGEPELGAPEARWGCWNGLWPIAFTADQEADDCDDEDTFDLEQACEDEGADAEGAGHATSNYAGPCSPISPGGQP